MAEMLQPCRQAILTMLFLLPNTLEGVENRYHEACLCCRVSFEAVTVPALYSEYVRRFQRT